MHASCRRGFSLIELIVVIAIISILLGMVLSVIAMVRKNAAIGAARTQMSIVATAMEQYRLDFGFYPPDDFPTTNGAEVLAWHLCRKHKKGDMSYGPYLNVPVQDSDKNGYDELNSPMRTPYFYVHTVDVKGRERGYVGVDVGWDKKIGGTLDPAMGFVPDASGADTDNIYRP